LPPSLLLPVNPVFDLSYHFAILHFLISVCTKLHIPSCYPHFTNHFPFLGRLHSVRLFWGHNLGFLLVNFLYGDRISACRPTPNLEGQSTVLIIPGTGWPSYTPRHRVPILVAFCDFHGLQWDCSFPRSPHSSPL
jgi:hypothetical protein